jgi:hypothetical protein
MDIQLILEFKDHIKTYNMPYHMSLCKLNFYEFGQQMKKMPFLSRLLHLK